MKARTLKPGTARTPAKAPSPVAPARPEAQPGPLGAASAFADLAIEPPGPDPSAAAPVVQRVTTRSKARADEEAGKKARKASAKARLARWHSRDAKRLKFQSGRYDHPLGPVTVSPGYNGQLMAQTRQGEYGGETFGSIPAYDKIRLHTKFPGAGRALYDPKFRPKGLTHKQRMAAVLAATTANVSENQRAPGMGKLIRALTRRHERVPGAPHFLDPAVNPATNSGGAQQARDLVTGVTPLNADQISAIDDDASDSSGDDEQTFAIRKGLLKKQATDGS